MTCPCWHACATLPGTLSVVASFPKRKTCQMLFLLRKTPLKPSATQIISCFSIPSRFFSEQTHQPNSINPNNPDEPTPASYDELIATAGRSRDFQTLHRLLNKRYKDGLFNTSKTFKFLTEFDELDTNLHDLLQTLANLDQGFCRKNAFDTLIIYLCKSNKISQSLQVVEKMVQIDVGVNAVTYHPLVDALVRNHHYDSAWRLLAEMKDMGITVDVTAYNFILTGYCFNSDLMAAAGVLEKMRKEGIKADSRTYDALVMGACKVGNVEGALVLLRRMEEEGLLTLYSTHCHVIKGLLALGCSAQAREFVMAFAGKDKKLDTENFEHLGNSLVRKKMLEEAKLVLGEMEKRGLAMGDKLRSHYKELIGSDTQSKDV